MSGEQLEFVVAEEVEWEGWLQYCNHPDDLIGTAPHAEACGKTSIKIIAENDDCPYRECTCFWNPESPDYWKKHVDPETWQPKTSMR